MQETQVQSLGWEDPLEEEMATRSSILAWEIPRTEEPGGLQSMGLQRVRHRLFGYARSWFQHAASSSLKVKSESRSAVSNSLRPQGLHSSWNSPGQNPGMCNLSLLRGSSQPTDRTQVSCIAGRFFTIRATGEAPAQGSDLGPLH